MTDLVARARDYAVNAHARINHLRKYTSLPYDVHLKGVVDLVARVTDDEEVIAAAWLHDTVEDTSATFEDIEREFGSAIRSLVMELTDISRPGDGNRAVRKEIDLDHLAMASARAKTVKLADLIDNCADICRNDPRFGAVFLQEMTDLLEVLNEGDKRLYEKARQTLNRSAQLLQINPPAARRSFPSVAEPERAFSPQEQANGELRIFKTAFQAGDISEPLASFDRENLDKEKILAGGAANRFAIGVRIDGTVAGYLLHEDLVSPSPLRVRSILPRQTVAIHTPLAEVIHILTMFSCCFVVAGQTVCGVINRQDIEKPAVRIWLFGIIMFIELIIVKHIRGRWPEGSWGEHVSAGRLEKAAALRKTRRQRGQEVDLLDCLQLGDKLGIVLNDQEFTGLLGFNSMSAAKRAVKDLELLRNNLAHGQEIAMQNWPPIVRLARRISELYS